MNASEPPARQSMDPILWEMLEQGEAGEEVAIIVRLRPDEAPPPNLRIVTQFGSIASGRLPREAILEVRADDSIGSLKGPRLVEPGLNISHVLDTELEAEAISSDQRRPDHLQADGRGVALGILDWGLDFAHPEFRRPDGTTRLLGLWDQRGPMRGVNRYGYGHIYTPDDINAALNSPFPYQALGYHPADADSARNGSHGTHVTSIAAGSLTGIAPKADLIFVHLSTTGTTGLTNLGDSVTLHEGLDYIVRTAGERPVVINMSVGRQAGPHDGLTLVEQAIDAMLSEAPGRALCQSVGNYFQQHAHTAGELRPGEERTILFEVDAADITPNELEFWYPGPDEFILTLRSPDGSINERVQLGENTPLILDGRKVGHIYHRRNDPNNHDNHIDIFLYPGSPAGQWQLILLGYDVVDGRYHGWIERDATCPGCQAHFMAQDSISNYTTGTICNGFKTIVVGAYNAHSPDHPLGSFSSVGPTRDGRAKPNLIAPGVAVLGARSTPGEQHTPQALYTRKTGTSMAAPHVAGTVALMFSAASRPLAIGETRRLLLRSTRRASSESARSGSGYLDIEAAVAAAAASSLTVPQPVPVTEAVRQTPGKVPVLAGMPIPLLQDEMEDSMSLDDSIPSNGDLGEPQAASILGDVFLESADCPDPTTRQVDGEADLEEAPFAKCADCPDPMFRVAEGEAEIGDEALELLLESAHAWCGGDAEEESILIESAGIEPAVDLDTLIDVPPSALFDTYAYQGVRRAELDHRFEVLALPGTTLEASLQPGDILVRRGEGDFAHAAVLATGDLIPRDQLATHRLTPEGRRRGFYAQVVEGGVYPHEQADGYARLVAEATRRVPTDQLIVRRRATGVASFVADSEDIPASDLRWEGATSEQLAFMRQVYAEHVRRASQRRSFVADVPASELNTIEGGHQARIEAARRCRELLAEARAALQAEQTRGVSEAQSAGDIAVVSAYRAASHQFRIWQSNFAQYYTQTRSQRAQLAGGEHGLAAVTMLAGYIGNRVAAPGYSLHNSGLAIDFSTRDRGVTLGATSSADSIQRWRRSWFYHWLTQNAARFGFHENTSINEPWHWEYRAADSASARQTEQAPEPERLADVRGAIDRSNFVEAFRILNGLWIAHMLRVLRELSSPALIRLQDNLPVAYRQFNGPRLEVAIQAERTRRGEVRLECARLISLPADQQREITTHLGENAGDYAQRQPRYNISDAGVRFIADHEGFCANLYDDATANCGRGRGHCTIGYGHLVHQGVCNGNEPAEFRRGINQERARELLRGDLAAAVNAVNRYTRVVLNQNQFDALVSFTFNVGSGAFRDSALLRRLNNCDFAAVPDQFMRWTRSGGQVVQGLVNRRTDERNLFNRAPAAADHIEAVSYDGNGFHGETAAIQEVVAVGLRPTRWGPIIRGSTLTSAVLRTGNAVRHLIDGPATFRQMVTAIRSTYSREHYIYLLGWSLDDSFEMIPGDPASTALRLLSAASGRGVQIRAMLWDQVGRQNSAEVRRINALPTGAAILDNETLRFGAHHQKVLIVRNNDALVTFCGGIDIFPDRITAPSSSSSSPQHDVHCQILGPSAHDLLATFIERWDHHPDHVTIDRSRGVLVGRTEPRPRPITSPSSLTSSTGRSTSVCIARTFNPVTSSGSAPRQRDIQTLLLAGIRNAQRFIYMEDQYLTSLTAAAALNRAVPRLDHLTILITASEILAGSGGFGSGGLPCVWKYRRDFIRVLTAGLSAADRAKVRIFQLVTPPATRMPPIFSNHTYVHAKIWVFDDELAVIGSANCNQRGWTHDSEVNAFIFDDEDETGGAPTFAQYFRMQLWSEHLSVSSSTVRDGVSSAALWLSPPSGAKIMAYNPIAGRDRESDPVCDNLRGVIDPTGP